MLPFLCFSPLFGSPLHDEFIGALVVACLVSASRLAPRGYRMTPATGLTLAAAVGMVHRVHGHAAVSRTHSHPALASRLADGNVFVVHVAYLTDGCHAIHQDFASLAGRQLDQRPIAFLGHQLRCAASGTHHLRALAGL